MALPGIDVAHKHLPKILDQARGISLMPQLKQLGIIRVPFASQGKTRGSELISILFAIIEPADEGFHPKVEEEWGEEISLEGAAEDSDVHGGAIWGEESGGSIPVEVRDNPAQVPWEAEES